MANIYRYLSSVYGVSIYNIIFQCMHTSEFQMRRCGPRPRRDRDKLETRPRRHQDVTETRPRRDRDETETRPRRDRDETETRPRRDRDETETRPRRDWNRGGSRGATGGHDPTKRLTTVFLHISYANYRWIIWGIRVDSDRMRCVFSLRIIASKITHA